MTSHEIYPAVALRHRRRRAPARHQPARLFAETERHDRAYKDVIDLLAKSGVTLTPTIGIQGAFQARATGDKALLYDSRLALFPLPVVAMLADLAGAPPNPALDLRGEAVRSDGESGVPPAAEKSSPAPTRRSCRTGSACTSSSKRTCTPG